MREIKFRGLSVRFDVDWVYGDVHFGVDNEKAHIHQVKGNNVSCFVDPKTIGQLVEWDYRSEVEIFGGDIVQYNDTEGRVYVKEVNYDKRTASWRFGVMPLSQITGSGYYQGMNLKAIGNVHQNPELLEQA